MRKVGLKLIVVFATLLMGGAIRAQNVAAPTKGGLPACQANSQAFPATGQTTSYVGGDDGAIEAGAPLSYTDNGDGTITDNNTKLMWEKKDEAGGLHDVNTTYAWAGTCSLNGATCGTDADCGASGGTCNAGGPVTIFQWVAELNAEAFSGHADWRIPNIKELDSIVDYGTEEPAVNAAFNTSCSSGCAVVGGNNMTMCSCTEAGTPYWSATTSVDSAGKAYDASFGVGFVGSENKPDTRHVRAVRGGFFSLVPKD